MKCLGNFTDCSLYVDDFCICYRPKSMGTIERQLQQNLNNIESWATSNGFKFSKSKTQCVHFCQLLSNMMILFYMGTIERQLQQNLNKIENWATSNGFKFSKSKIQCVHFCQLHSNMMILFYIYMDHLFQLLRNLNSLASYLIETQFYTHIKYLIGL